MEKKLGRKLKRNEWVHHKNGDRKDNRMSNLEVMLGVEHARHHMLKHQVVKVCEVCGASYTPETSKRARQRTCSWSCRNKLISLVRLGLKQPAYALKARTW